MTKEEQRQTIITTMEVVMLSQHEAGRTWRSLAMYLFIAVPQLAILDEDQTLPDEIKACYQMGIGYFCGYKQAQEDMLATGFKKVL
jgi:hypothetical protein